MFCTSVVVIWLWACSFLLVFKRGFGCDEYLSSKTKQRGIFNSPYYPDTYSGRKQCKYVFTNRGDQRIRITFDMVDLHPPDKDKKCVSEYIKVYFLNDEMKKKLFINLCGQKTPYPIITSSHGVLIMFKKDKGTKFKGFLARYEFLDESEKIFPHSLEKCGQDLLTGVGGTITSPGHPQPYWSLVHCTWVIKVKPWQRILITLTDLDLPSDECDVVNLSIYEGLADPNRAPNFKLCGEIPHIKSGRDFITMKPLATVRFYSGRSNPLQQAGFKLAWTAVTIPTSANGCSDFYCEGGEECFDTAGWLCRPTPRYCIHPSLRCNSEPNCGAIDKSDEATCYVTTLIAVLSLVCAAILIVICGATAAFIYRRRKQQTQQLQMSTCIRNLHHSPSMGRNSSLPAKFTSFENGFNSSQETGIETTAEVFKVKRQSSNSKPHSKRTNTGTHETRLKTKAEVCKVKNQSSELRSKKKNTGAHVVFRKVKKSREENIVIKNEYIDLMPMKPQTRSIQQQNRPTSLPVLKSNLTYMNVHVSVGYKDGRKTKGTVV